MMCLQTKESQIIGNYQNPTRDKGKDSLRPFRAPVLLPGKSQGRRNLAVYAPRGRTESNTTEHPHCTSCLQMPHFMRCGFRAGSPVCPRAPQPLQVRLAGMRALLSHLPPVLEYQRGQGTHGLGVDVYGPRPPRQLQSS